MDMKNRPVKIIRKDMGDRIDDLIVDIHVESEDGDWSSLEKMRKYMDCLSQAGFNNSKYHEETYADYVKERDAEGRKI